MRIFNIMMSRDLGGIQQSFLDYSTALKNEGEEVIDITSSFARINEKLPTSIKLPNLFQWCIFSKIYLRILIAIYRPDILLAHGGRAISFACSFKPSSLPLIGIAHNYKTRRLQKCDYVISVTNILIDYLAHHGFNRNNIFHIPNMIKVTQGYREKQYKKPLIIGSFGRFVAKKGFNYLIEAIALLKNQGHNINLLLGGAGEEEPILRKLVTRLNLLNEVTFLGWIEDKEKFFKRIDIFCLPSTSEPFGIILLEAIENSTPIVATKSGGPGEIIRDKQDGLLTEIESGADLAEKLSMLILNQEEANKLSSSAYLRLIENYEIKIVGKKLVNILNNIYTKRSINYEFSK
ncbi:MAG: glycosyltransferase family 4 protein [Rickettsiaceae bacterium]|nr:glycosyltransferase family 4 protein [Rickettsiaceae bacterium]MCP5377840.1 glycosyltransferase family 4 protein [Rickettsiaceae bacterium]